MNILYGISVVVLYTSFFYGAEGQASCALVYEDGTVLSESDWSWGFGLNAIEDITPPGTVLLNMTTSAINVIWSVEPDSNSGYKFIEPVLLDGRFIVTLTDYFTQYEELETEPTIRMKVNFGCSVDNRTLDLIQPITDTNNNYPEFQNAPYFYELPIPLPSGFSIQLFGAISARDIDLSNTNISFTLNSSDPNAAGFSASWLSRDATDTKLHYAQLLTTALLSIEEDVSFNIYATDNGVPPLTSETIITIHVDEENSVPPNPVFAHPVYIADHSDITIEEASGTVVAFNQGNIALSQGIDDTVEYTLVDNIGSYEENFLLTISEDNSYVSVTLQNVTEEFLAEEYVVLTLTATRSGAAETGVTILHIGLPGIISCNTTTPNDTSNTTSSSLDFSTSVYTFEKNSSFTGILMTEKAVATNAEGVIVYGVTFDDEDLASRIIMNADTAELEVTATISPGLYVFKIMATIEELNLSTSANVVLVIAAPTESSGEIIFGHALQVIELEEESVHENVLPLDDNGCDYTIYSQSPSQNLFSINGNSLNSVAIDREASYFSEMSVAQVRLIIDASCPNETDTGTTRLKRDTEYEVLTENIAYQRTRTVLIVIITDINDNVPVWSSDTPSYIGFPGYELSQLIHVPYVYQFMATDADIGDNAKVTYILPSGSDGVFHIHNTEGSLYIQQGVYIEDGLQFTIIATDGEFETPTELNVRMLESYNVVVLFIAGGVLEDVENIIEDLSTSTGYWIRSLGSAVISESDTSSSKSLTSVSRKMAKASDANTLLRLLVYGLENNEPVSSENLVSVLQTADLTWAISNSATLESILSENTETGTLDPVDTQGYRVAIIVLSVLLFLVIIAAAVVYFVFRRPRKATSIESDVTYENFDNSNSNGSNTGHNLKSVTLSESQDDAFSVSPPPVKKKSVAFKAVVEEFEVATL